MGRLATSIAATATHADNLPGALPNVSALDVLLPRSLAGSKRTEKPRHNSSNSLVLPPAAVGDAEIKRDSKGRLVMVRHKGSSIHGRGNSISGSDVITFEDLKKSVERMKEHEGGEEKTGGEDSKNLEPNKDKPEGEGRVEKKDDGWTADEDAKLREFKNNGKGTPWKDIAAEMNKDLEDLKTHWQVLKAAGQDRGGEGNKAGDGKADNRKPDEKKDVSAGMGKDGKGKTGGEGTGNQKKHEDKKCGGQQKMDQFVFTEEQDKELRECVAAGMNWKLTAKTVKRSQDACKKRWEEIGGNDAKDEPKRDELTKDETLRNEFKKDPLREDKPSLKTGSKKHETTKQASVPKAASIAGSTRSTRSSVKFSIREWRALQEDDFFSFEELQILCQLIGKQGDSSWLSIASAFHDKTGRRVHPEDIREKFEAMGKVQV